MHRPRYGEPEFGFLVFGRVASREDGTRFRDFAERAFDDPVQDGLIQFLAWKSEQVQARERAPAHRVDIAERVGRRDLAKRERVIDRWRDDVSGDDDGQIFGDPVHTRIIAGVEPDQQVRIVHLWQFREQFSQSDRTDLGRSAAGFSETGQGLLFVSE